MIAQGEENTGLFTDRARVNDQLGQSPTIQCAHLRCGQFLGMLPQSEIFVIEGGGDPSVNPDQGVQ